jgi:hypothetical protein
MPRRPKYRVVFEEDPRFVGRGDGRYGDVSTFVKACSDVSPYCVPNELICGEIGRFLRLPVPPFGIVSSTTDKNPLFASMRFAQDRPPGVDPERCVERFPWLCAGVLLLDIFVANEDRHDENLAADSRSNPKQLYVFDHDVALFGWKSGGAIERLGLLRDRLGVSGSPVTRGNRHCFLDLVSNVDHMREWIQRISTIPEWFIDAVCREAVGTGVSAKEAAAGADFLKGRRYQMDSIIRNFQSEFKAVRDWGLW